MPEKMIQVNNLKSLKETEEGSDSDNDSDSPSSEDSSRTTGDENVVRGNWSRQLDFFLSCVGFAVGLGNLWRFPYLCMRNGGGAFLIPYFIFLCTCGIPLFFMELVIGQFSSCSPLSVWKICPLLKGIGIGMVMVSGICTIYYNMIIGWILYYLGMSFTAELPWATCGNPWNTPNCAVRGRSALLANSSYGEAFHPNATSGTNHVYDMFRQNMSYSSNESLSMNGSIAMEMTNATKKLATPAEEFWQYNVLELSAGIDEFGGIQWKLMLCLIAAWALVFLCLIKGIKSSGKVVYVTATAPYVLLMLLMIRGVMLPGAADGIRYYLTPQWSKLLEFKVWTEACLQIFYSLGPAWGGLITMASYSRFNNNMYRDAVLIPLINSGTSFFAGFVIFSIIGFMAHDANVPVEEVIKSGPGLAFIAYPEALTKLPISPLWAIMFFLMLLSVGLGTQFGMFETFVSGIVDRFPGLLRFFRYKWVITAGCALLQFVIGIPLVSRAGMYYFQIVDWYSAAFSVTLLALLECIVVSMIYGTDRVYDNIKLMIGYKPTRLWKVLWCGVTPLILTAILITSLVNFPRPKYGEYEYPDWAINMGWVISSVSLIPIPVMAVYQIAHAEGTLLQRIRFLLKPAKDWGPALEIHRETYKHIENEKMAL